MEFFSALISLLKLLNPVQIVLGLNNLVKKYFTWRNDLEKREAELNLMNQEVAFLERLGYTKRQIREWLETHRNIKQLH